MEAGLQPVAQRRDLSGGELHAIEAALTESIPVAAQRQTPGAAEIEGSLPARAASPSSKILEGYAEVIRKLFQADDSGKPRCLYHRELEATAKELGCSRDELLDRGLRELWVNGEPLAARAGFDADAAEKVGKHFEAIGKIIRHHAELHVIGTMGHLEDEKLPLSPDYKSKVRSVVGAGEAVALLIIKSPPEEAAIEIRKVTDEKLAGLTPLWSDERFRSKLSLSPALKDFLQYATVRVLCTGENQEATALTREMNVAMERKGEFEDRHWIKVVKQISQSEQHESLSGALKVCVPIVVAVKLAEKFMPGAMHAIGGALDDLFGAVIPNVSQSMGRKDLPFKERLRSAAGILIGGLASVPVSAMAGWGALKMYDGATSLGMKMAAGALFAVACCAGTAATSAVALYQTWKAINKLGENPEFKEIIDGMSFGEKAKLAFRSAILDVPFRIGHTCIGVPAQVGLGMAAGAFGFFHSGLFVAAEGMLETIFGAVTAYLYPYYAKWRRDSTLRESKV